MTALMPIRPTNRPHRRALAAETQTNLGGAALIRRRSMELEMYVLAAVITALAVFWIGLKAADPDGEDWG
ncbi:MAG: hypothetical protein AAFQ15_13450 [Pseudomonadota bacterium]